MDAYHVYVMYIQEYYTCIYLFNIWVIVIAIKGKQQIFSCSMFPRCPIPFLWLYELSLWIELSSAMTITFLFDATLSRGDISDPHSPVTTPA